jgi:shikimate kinase
LSLSENDIIHISANLSRSSGYYHLGGLEGVYASLRGGVVYTDNMGGRIITWFNQVPDNTVLIGFKKYQEINILETLKEIRKFSELFKKVFDVGQKGGHLKAITLNGLLYSILTNMDYDTLVEALTRGAVAAGVAGVGPGIVLITKHEDVGMFKDMLRDRGYNVIETRPTNRECRYKIIEE